MVNKISKNYDLQSKDLHLFKKLCSSLDINYKLENINKLEYVKIPFYVDIVDNAKYIINNKYFDCVYEDNSLNFLNNLLWIYLQSNQRFIKHSSNFKNICNNFVKKYGDFDPLYSINHNF